MPAGATQRQRCPECRAASVEEFRPFCSKRCADLDLARWLTGGYAIPAGDAPDEEGDAVTPAPPGRLPN